ncbi:MAG: hypothetical protein HYR96_08455 [Deltaproteobacteria bacterium]|nr:hypothetical protein [Deltaproteobacteria bacterium]
MNVPEHLIKMATQATGKGITDTIVEGLQELEKREKRAALRNLRGKIVLELNLEKTRR